MAQTASRNEAPSCTNPSCKAITPERVLHCGACKQASYCSPDCQKQDWKSHKPYCKHVSSNGSSSHSLGPLDYYRKIATKDHGVKALLHDIKLPPPDSDTNSHGLNKPLRRLAITGKDTPEILALFFGAHNSRAVAETHKEIRSEVLLHPPPGSPSYVMSHSLKLDEDCPAWTPREASAEEAVELNKVRRMQDMIRSHVTSQGRGMNDVSSKDMQDILTKNFGNRWVEALGTYQQALNFMDQGVPITGRR